MSAPSLHDAATRADPLGPCLERYLVLGDEAAMEEVVRRTRPRLLSAARRIGAPGDAEDSVQAAYLSLVRKRGARLEAPVLPWLLTAVVRIAYRRKALERREVRLAERLALAGTPGSAATSAADAEDVALLRREVDRLPARYRDPLVLALHGLSIAETGRLLDMPEATVRTRLHRARRLVRSRGTLAPFALLVPWWIADGARSVLANAWTFSLGALVKTNAVVVTAVALLAAAVGLGVGMLTRPEPQDTARATRAESRLKTIEAELAALKKDYASAQAALAAAPPPLRETEAPTLAGRASPVGLAPAAPAPVEKPAEPLAAVNGARFKVPGYDAALDEVDWSLVGGNLAKMKSELDKIAESRRTGVPLAPDLIGRIQTLNGPLVTAALKFEQTAKTGHPNAAFTHPAFQANVIEATLKAAGVPLSEAQASALADLGVRFTEEDTQRTKAYDPSTFALRRVVEEAQLRDRFFEATFSLLSPEQRAALVSPDLRDRLQVDLFSSGLLWLGRAELVKFRSQDLLVSSLESRLVQALDADLTETQRADLKRLLQNWLREWPTAALETPADTYSLEGSPTSSYVTACGVRQISLLERVAPTLRLDAKAAEKMRTYAFAWVLLRSAEGT